MELRKSLKIFSFLFFTLLGVVLINLPFVEEMQLSGFPYIPSQYSYLRDNNIFDKINWMDFYSIFFMSLVSLAAILFKNKKILLTLIIAGLLLDGFAIANLYYLTMNFCVCKITIYGTFIIAACIFQFIAAIILSGSEYQYYIKSQHKESLT